MKRDLSKIFKIPCLPVSLPHAIQPQELTMPLHDYQLRAVHRMMAIEEGIEIVADKLYTPRGGVLCDAVGTGKTATIIGLIVSSKATIPPGCIAPNVVICPEHLTEQWKAEVAKFAPGLRIAFRNPVLAPGTIDADIWIISLDDFFIMHMQAPPNFLFKFGRVLLDECHDAVALGSRPTKALASIVTDRFWCVTGTPFPLADTSVYGINQLLHIKVLEFSLILPSHFIVILFYFFH